MTRFNLGEIQRALCDFGWDGWLLYNFRESNPLAQRVLNVETPGSRRFFYAIPSQGEPQGLVHRIESGALDHLPGPKRVYLTWQELEAGVAALVGGMKTAAMEYSPRNANPYVSRVDAGAVELVRSFGIDVVSSGDLIQLFEATWDDEQWQLHREAALHTDSAFDRAWRFIADRVRVKGEVEETDVRAVIMEHFREHGLTTYHAPIVAVGHHSGDPHYETGTGSETAIRAGDFVLIDLWAKLDRPKGVYSDLTRVGYVGESVPARYDEIFKIVARARDAALDFIQAALVSGREIRGWEVDQAARRVIVDAGFGERFIHRTGHSIGEETHGNGANMDNLETREERRVLRRTCFSIEPGVYLPEFGVRSEVNVFIDGEGRMHVTGGERQTEVLPILKAY